MNPNKPTVATMTPGELIVCIAGGMVAGGLLLGLPLAVILFLVTR